MSINVEDIPWDMSKEEFERDWEYKPLVIRGIYDHSQETMVVRTRHEERGFEIVTPMYTKVDKQTGNLKGILVNRGRIPLDLQFS